MKSIKTKIISIMLLVIILNSIILGAMGCVLNYKSSMNVLELTMTEMVKVTADRIQYEMKSYSNISFEAGTSPLLSDQASSVNEKKNFIDQKVKDHGFQRGNVIGADGISLFDGKDYSDRNYFQESMNGKVFISEPIISKVTNELSIIISAPIWKDGTNGSTVIGVVYFVPKETFLNDIVAGINIGENGNAYMLNKDGLTIAHKNGEIVGKENTQEDAKKNKKLESIAALEKLMTEGKTGFGSYTYGGTKKSMAFAPVGGTDGWSISVCAVTNEFIGGAIQAIILTIIICIIFILIGLIIAIRFAKGIANPIRLCCDRLKLLSQGDLKAPVPEITSRDETGELLSSLQVLVKELNESIGDVSYHLKEMGDGNFSLHVTRDYQGDFSQLKTSIERINVSLNEVLHQISANSDQVSSGSQQVSSGAQALAQGTTEQASSIQELSATISEISDHVKENALNAQRANELSATTGEEVMSSNAQMKQLLEAMSDISEKSGEIGKIIKSIEDIAFQTNILALNAAVEAARAGDAGKGFAVVADEVRNLAGKSAEAAQNTTALIEASLCAVDNGTALTEKTAESMEAMVASAGKVISEIDKISEASKVQSDSISQITIGIDQISSVIQTNSATAEESAAASEELSGQAEMLKGMVSKFRLR